MLARVSTSAHDPSRTTEGGGDHDTSSSTTTFVLVKSVLGPATAAVTIGLMLLWLRSELARTGSRLVRAAAASLPAPALQRT
jgi:hypothetical protein